MAYLIQQDKGNKSSDICANTREKAYMQVIRAPAILCNHRFVLQDCGIIKFYYLATIWINRQVCGQVNGQNPLV